MKQKQLTAFLRANRKLVGVLIISSVIGLWFLFHLMADFIYFHDPRNTDVELKGWMTPRFIGLTYDLPRPYVLEILELPDKFHGPKRLRHVADDLGMSLDELTAYVRLKAAEYRSDSYD